MPTSLVAKGETVLQDQRKGKLQPYRQEQVRAQIQVRSILNIIQDHVLNGTEISQSRIHAGLKLINKVLPDAIPDAVTNNLQANTALALQSINQAQLMAMAQEMLANNVSRETIDGQASIVPDSKGECLLTDEKLTESEQSLTKEKVMGGYGKDGVPLNDSDSNPSPAQEFSHPYHNLPDELG